LQVTIMNTVLIPWTNRRAFLRGCLLTTAALWTPGVFAEELARTPRQTEGPFYPDRLPLDTDNDLLLINDSITPAVGTVAHLSGRVLGPSGEPVRNAVVEIWEADANGAYIHTQSINAARRDKNFQGYGRFLTGSSGEYYFRTIKPAGYAGRTPHIHFAVLKGSRRLLTTQLYVKGEPRNNTDPVLRGIRDPRARESVIVDFKALSNSRVGELTASFPIVLGFTPEDPEPSLGRPGRGPS